MQSGWEINEEQANAAEQQRQELDRVKRQLCEENNVRLIEWPYSTPPTEENIEAVLVEKP